MRLAASSALDALCGEYLLGTLRGPARRRFARALEEEPAVALRLRYWQSIFAPKYTTSVAVEPSAAVWKRLKGELGLAKYRVPWHRRLAVWHGIAAAAAAALAVAVGLQVLRPEPSAPPTLEIAQLEGKAEAARVVARLTRDARVLALEPTRPVLAGPNQSYELWLLPAEGGAPVSLAVLGSLEAQFPLAPAHAARLRSGGKLAVSVEPAGGSPTGGPTGPVILVGSINI